MNSLQQTHDVRLRGLACFGVGEVRVARPDYRLWFGVRDGIGA
jgi:hypothetical protein